jgi:hypothetical protein
MDDLDFNPAEYFAKKSKLDKMRYNWIFVAGFKIWIILLLDISTQNNNFLDFHIFLMSLLKNIFTNTNIIF